MGLTVWNRLPHTNILPQLQNTKETKAIYMTVEVEVALLSLN